MGKFIARTIIENYGKYKLDMLSWPLSSDMYFIWKAIN